MADRNYLAIGKIRTSHGVKGYLKIINFSGESDHFCRLESVSLEYSGKKTVVKIEDVRVLSNDILIKFAGIDTPEDAKKFINHEIWVPRENAAALDKGEYYFADICGCTLVSGEKVYGKVISIIEGGADYLLEIEGEIEGENRKVFLVPFRSGFIGDINTRLKTIELLEEWIIP